MIDHPSGPFVGQIYPSPDGSTKWRCEVAGPPAQWRIVRDDQVVKLSDIQTLFHKTMKNMALLSQVVAYSATPAWDMDLGQILDLGVLTGNAVITATNLPPAGVAMLRTTQDATGGRLVTFAGTNVVLPAASSTAPGRVTVWHGTIVGGILYMHETNSVGAPAPTPAPAPAPAGAHVGTNISGMEWAQPGLRYGQSTVQNINWTPARINHIKWLMSRGMTKLRLPVQWELLQPLLSDSPASATVKAAHGVAAAGDFSGPHQTILDGLFNAAATVGCKIILDLHNYCRYIDFVYDGSGNVVGFTDPADPLVPPYTTDSSKVTERIFSKAAGATLTTAAYTNFWTKVATRWGGNAGFGGYGLMNEPNNLPSATGTVGYGSPEDKTIIGTYFAAAITAIRAIDAVNPIYVGGNNYQFSATMGDPAQNPSFPLAGTNLIYDVHCYEDAVSSGAKFDYDLEVAKNLSAGLTPSNVPIDVNTMKNRLKLATDWAATFTPALKLAVTESGMPVDDVRWQNMYETACDYVHSLGTAGVEIYSWMGGDHWPTQAHGINHTPEWMQDKTVPPLVEGPLRKTRNLESDVVWIEGDAYSSGGAALNLRVSRRGWKSTSTTVTVASDNGGAFSTTNLVIPAGLNKFFDFTFTPAGNSIATLSFTGATTNPPPYKVFSLTDPVAYAATNLSDAAHCILAKYKAGKWEIKHGFTDYLDNVAVLSGVGQEIRAIRDSGYAGTVQNPMGMRLTWNKDAHMQTGENNITPLMAVAAGVKSADMNTYTTNGWWCKKQTPTPDDERPNPTVKAMFKISDPHFMLAAAKSGNPFGKLAGNTNANDYVRSVMFCDGSNIPKLEIVDGAYTTTTLTSAAGALPLNTNSVISCRIASGDQRLYINNVERASAAVAISAAGGATANLNNHSMATAFWHYYPSDNWLGNYYGCIIGKGALTVAEHTVLHNYMATLWT